MPVVAGAQIQSSIQGRVLDPTGALVGHAKVSVEDGATTTTDVRGEFRIPNAITQGAVLFVSAPGFQTSRVAINANASDITVKLQVGIESQVVTVSASHTGYVASEDTVATKSSVALKETPQAVAVVEREVIVDQNSISIDEILRNVAGASGPARQQVGLDYNGAANASYKVRGFLANTYQDGLPYRFGTGFRDSTIDIAKLEVLKGPTAALYGGSTGSPIGGIIDTISERPETESHYSVNLRGGSFQFLNPSVDLNQRLTKDGKLMGRITAEYESSDTFVDYFHRQGWAVNPSIRWSDAKTDVLLLGSYSDLKQPDYTGLPTTGMLTGDFKIPYAFSFNGPLAPQTDSKLGYLTSITQRTFNKIWSADMALRYSNGDKYEPAFALFTNTPDPGTKGFSEAPLLLTQNQTEINLNPNLHGHWTTAKFSNDALVGFEFDHVSDSSQIDLGDFFSLDPLRPQYEAFPTAPLPVDVTQTNFYTTCAGYLQDQLTVAKRLHLLGALRFTGLEVDANSPAAGTVYDVVAKKVTPRVGAVVDVTRWMSLFADYGKGFQLPEGVLTVNTVKPEASDQIEGGIKIGTGALQTTISGFRLRRNNAPTPDPNNPFYSLQEGEQRVQGLDTDTTWQPTRLRGLSVIGSFAFLDSALLKDTTYPIGGRLTAVPEFSGRIWANYRLDAGTYRGLSFGAGVYANSRQAVDPTNALFTGSTSLFDVRVAYVLRGRGKLSRATLHVDAKNLGNVHDLAPYVYLVNNVAPVEPRAVYAGISTRF